MTIKLKASQRTIPQIRAFVEEYVGQLPHGSGIDADWSVCTNARSDRLFLDNSFHRMNEGGCYDGWQDFRVTIFRHKTDKYNKLIGPMKSHKQAIHKKGDVDFKLSFPGGFYRCSSSYDLREYLEEMFQCALLELGILTGLHSLEIA